MKKRHQYFFIIIPAAKNGRVLVAWQRVEDYLKSNKVAYLYAFSRNAEHLAELAKEGAEKGAEKDYIIVAVGGDGTVSRIAGALAGTGKAMGLIPAGTGNDFARSLSLPTDPVAACKTVLTGRRTKLDIGLFNGRAFCNVVGAGLDAEVVADANNVFKRYCGSLSYVFALLKQLFAYKPPRIKLVVDGEEYVADAWLVAVANGRYFGNGMRIAPEADPRDGLLDVIVVSNISRVTFLRLFPLVYSGKHISLPVIKTWRGTDISLFCDKPVSIQADGEFAGKTPLNATVRKKALEFLLTADE